MHFAVVIWVCSHSTLALLLAASMLLKRQRHKDAEASKHTMAAAKETAYVESLLAVMCCNLLWCLVPTALEKGAPTLQR